MKSRNIVFISFISIIIVLSLLSLYWDDLIPFYNVKIFIQEQGVLAPIVFIIFYVIGSIFMPKSPFMILAGLIFGFKAGFLYSFIGSFLSAMLLFSLSRKLGASFAEKILQHEKLQKLSKHNDNIDQHGLWSLIILRVTPIMPFNVINILMGLSKISTTDYMFGSLIGLLPSQILTVYTGSLITKIF